MKKLIAIILLNCLYTPIGFAQNPAQQAPKSNIQKLNECIEKCRNTPNQTNQQTLTCQNTCRTQQNGQNNFLPPIVKPDLLPGPTFDDNTKRTGQEVTKYVTEKLLPRTATRLITIVAITSMLALIYAGITYFSAFGDTEKGTKGKSIAIYAIVGLLISLLSFTIVQIISNLPLTT